MQAGKEIGNGCSCQSSISEQHVLKIPDLNILLKRTSEDGAESTSRGLTGRAQHLPRQYKELRRIGKGVLEGCVISYQHYKATALRKY